MQLHNSSIIATLLFYFIFLDLEGIDFKRFIYLVCSRNFFDLIASFSLNYVHIVVF